MSNYTEQNRRMLLRRIREVLKTLPDACTEFIQSIDMTTQPLTRYAYVCDLKLFCDYLIAEDPAFADKQAADLTYDDFGRITARQMRNYMDYLGYYVKHDDEYSNAELGKMRKLATLRSFYKFLFTSEYIESDTSKLISMPKRHEKPIIRLEIDEVAHMLDIVESGEAQSDRQRKYNDHIRMRDLTILTVFLGTGIRVSELVGLNLSDVDFGTNSFLVTRKGGKQTILYYPDEVADVLKSYIAERQKIEASPGDEDALFLSLQRRRISVRSVQVMVKKYATAAAPNKPHLSPHKLRSTFGTNLYHETQDIYLVAEVLGHSDINTTRRHYAAMSDDLRRRAARSVKLRRDDDIAKTNDES